MQPAEVIHLRIEQCHLPRTGWGRWHLRENGLPPQRGRTSAVRRLVLQAPAPVIAKALGYHDKTTTRLVTKAGGAWNRYAPGDR
ncbi:hypothetical protein OG568_58535 (plasmid) [Streptomyces sp. NBC_01450]|uniref:hypothetical protein n=1 Tax=Streptomyces sp. NBC_01450 TaxID=2903871 RepID=UPI002E2FF48A|nr:hypothetical protein [Streptomyces sp. NBC_01450]